jgi:glyoxylase-like metal-dependent hydrolase (beta-lactamase superfamily II)
MQIEALYHESTGTLTYIVWDEQTRDALIIDSVMDFDPLRVSISTEALQALYTEVESRQLCVQAVIDTHAHADHLSGMAEVKTRYGCVSIVGSGMCRVQQTFAPIFGMGSQFDHLLKDGECLELGSLSIRAMHTPGHTPSCTCFLIGDAVFTGDALFMPDFGTGRCDFPNGSAADLYDSVVGKLYALPAETRVFVGHDYRSAERPLCYQSTIGECATANKQLCANTIRADFVRWRTERDSGLNLPGLLFQAIQININAGQLPPTNSEGVRHLSLPIGQFDRIDV